MTYDLWLGVVAPALGLFYWWLFGRLRVRVRWAPERPRPLAREQERLDRRDRRLAWRALGGLAALVGWLTLILATSQ